MRLIAQKPCSFGGRKYYIGDEVPVEDVINPAVHKSQGTLAILNDEQETVLEMTEAGKITIPVIKDGDGDVADVLVIPLTEGEVQHVFAIMQMTADKAAEAMEEVTSKEVLTVLYAADSRSGVKKAAKKRTEQLSAIEQDQNESVGGNETTKEGSKESSGAAEIEEA